MQIATHIPNDEKPRIDTVGNSSARAYVQRCEEFNGSNTYGRVVRVNAGRDNEEKMYVVYSYGVHWPLFIYHEPTGEWYENHEKHSRTTSKHRSQLHPLCYTKTLPIGAMVKLADDGLLALLEYMTSAHTVRGVQRVARGNTYG